MTWGKSSVLRICVTRQISRTSADGVAMTCSSDESTATMLFGATSCGQGAQSARKSGAHVVAVTAWSLLGAFDWNHLVTCKNDHYESGVFDIRGSEPRPTALASLLKELSSGQEPQHPVLKVPGWWHRSA